MDQSNTNNIFFVNNNIIDFNNKLNKEIKFDKIGRTNSISTNATFENDFSSDEEIDFNQDFFPQNKTIKFTNFLVDNWELKIKSYLININKKLLNIQKNSSVLNNQDYLNL